MARFKPYQTILISSIVLVIVFVCTLVFSGHVSQRHAKHVEEMSRLFHYRNALGDLGANFDHYIVELQKDTLKKELNNKKKWVEFHIQINQKISDLDSVVTDPGVHIYLSELKTINERLSRFVDSALKSGTADMTELYVYHNKFGSLKNNIIQYFLGRYAFHKDASAALLKQGRVASIFIIIFGAAVALALAVSVYLVM